MEANLSILDFTEDLEEYNVAGLTAAVLDGGSVHEIVFGEAGRDRPMTTNDWIQHASFSKTVASVFAIEYFSNQDIPMTTGVNQIFREIGSEFRLESKPECPTEWADSLQLKHLLNHTALGMHYVFGIPREDGMASPIDLISGAVDRYEPLMVAREPGSSFSYSGGGFVVLQHLIEEMEKKPVHEVTRSFLDGCGMVDYSFDQSQQGTQSDGATHVYGHTDDREEVPTLMYPPFAAGGHGTPAAMANMLRHLSIAYHLPQGSGPISHYTAKLMLGEESLLDKGCQDFMNSEMGLGVFVAKGITAEGEVNKFMLHQAANDGFRGVFMICFDGPGAANGPKGFVLISNGDNRAMFMNCVVSKALLKCLAIDGMDWSKVDNKTFNLAGLKQAEIVNLGLKELVLDALMTAEDVDVSADNFKTAYVSQESNVCVSQMV